MESFHCGPEELESLRDVLDFESGAMLGVEVLPWPRSVTIIILLIEVVIVEDVMGSAHGLLGQLPFETLEPLLTYAVDL